MIYGSVCSGIEAASVAWGPLGFKAAWLAEIDPFCCAVLRHRFPATYNLGDVTAPGFTEEAKARGHIDILVGGTPCQSFSLVGRRGGFHDPRGLLTLRYCDILERLRPDWLVWENVPGVLSSSGGRDFGAFLGRLDELGYGWVYRVLDARDFGLAQTRRRVYLVGRAGGRCPREVLADEELGGGHPLQLQGDGVVHPPRHEEVHGEPAHWRDTRAVAFRGRGDRNLKQVEVGGVIANALTASEGRGLVKPYVWHKGVLRRMTPREYERLQGFPDDHTLVPWNRGMASDTQRYKAVGNSMAVPVMRWIGERLMFARQSGG